MSTVPSTAALRRKLRCFSETVERLFTIQSNAACPKTAVFGQMSRHFIHPQKH
jgi:hypothetical protein